MGTAWMLVAVMGSWPGDASIGVGVQRARVDVIEGNQVQTAVSTELPNGQNAWKWDFGPMYVNYRRWEPAFAWYRVMDWTNAESVAMDWIRGEPVALVQSKRGVVLVRAWKYHETWGCDTESAERERYVRMRVRSDTPGIPGMKWLVR